VIISSCCGCGEGEGTGDCPCTVDEFTSPLSSEYSTTGSAFSVSSGVLTTTGAGRAYKLFVITPGFQQVGGIEVDVINNSHSLFGAYYGPTDNQAKLEWDVANTQLIFTPVVGGVTGTPVTYAGNPTTSIGLRITGEEGAWTFSVLKDGVELGTHLLAITFDTRTIDAGVISGTGGGTWDNLCIRSCEKACITCAGLIMPVAWRLDTAGAFTENPAHENTFLCEGNWVEAFNGTWTMMWHRFVSGAYIVLGRNPPDVALETSFLGGSPCAFYSVFEEPFEIYEDSVPGGLGIDPDLWPGGVITNPLLFPALSHPTNPSGILVHGKRISCAGGAAVFNKLNTAGDGMGVTAWGMQIYRIGVTGSWTLRIQAVAAISHHMDANTPTFSTFIASYSGDKFIGSDLDIRNVGEVTLDLVQVNTETGEPIAFAADSITIAPIQDGELIEDRTLLGSNGCDGNVSPNPICPSLYAETGILVLFGDISGDEFRTCLSGDAGWVKGPYTGQIEQVEYPIAACPSDPVLFSLACEETSPGIKEWILTITAGTDTAKVPFTPYLDQTGFNGTLSASGITLCGQVVNFSALLSDFDLSGLQDHPFVACCEEPDLGLLCSYPDTLGAEGRFENGTCGCTPHSEQLSLTSGALPLCTTDGLPPDIPFFDNTKQYFIGDFVFGGTFGQFIGWRLLMYCATEGGLMWAALDGNGCFFTGGGVTFDCGAFTGTTGNIYGLNGILLGCCMDDIGEAYIDFGGGG
jgi:hypothetical protein